jgi:hypothetical protein
MLIHQHADSAARYHKGIFAQRGNSAAPFFRIAIVPIDPGLAGKAVFCPYGFWRGTAVVGVGAASKEQRGGEGEDCQHEGCGFACVLVHVKLLMCFVNCYPLYERRLWHQCVSFENMSYFLR